MKIDIASLKEVLIIGFPAGIQGLAFSIPNVMIQSSLYSITDYVANGVSISMDDYFHNREDTPKKPNGEYDFENIEAIDLELFNNHLNNNFLYDSWDHSFLFYYGVILRNNTINIV